MSDFFTKRLHDYEEHMSVWEESYQLFAEVLPLECQKILDLGCGTGLELDKNCYVHFDIPMTLEHEKNLLQDAGFVIKKVLDG